ncbi:MAG: Mut7-C ubiquitin/RNAse domain-containing protein [Deltaproteobacteria bacterium]|nr:Mut7-C ubiquitin/RNAse domain-containing protein [Deltaproteobacteria bacterium]
MKVKTTFRFYEELNDFLPVHRKKVDFDVKFEGKRSIKDIIESLGAPHTEIDLILVNGKSVDFHYILQDKDRVSVYPVFESLNIIDVTHLRIFPLRRTKFITDVHLGKIAKYMRVLGFDVYYNSLLSIREIIEISKKENRIILTTSRKLLKFKDVSHGIFIRPAATTKQIKRIIDYLDIKEIIEPFTRCLWCNTLLNIVLKEDILEKIPPKTREFCNEYVQCQSCDKIYWKGSHYIHMEKVIRTMLDNPES